MILYRIVVGCVSLCMLSIYSTYLLTLSFQDENPQMEMAQKHHIVQETLVHKVYLDGLIEECGFPAGEDGYVRMQLAMADHQNDPLVAQYVGASMMQILQVAGLAGDMEAMQQAVSQS